MQNPEMKKQEGADCSAAVSIKIKEMWTRLSEEDVKLYGTDREKFLSRLKEKQNLTRDDGEKKLREIEKACAEKGEAAKSSPAKVA